MDVSTGVGGGIADDHEFQVAQDGELPPEPEPGADDTREIGDGDQDDVVGIDAERRVVLPQERPADED
ncbi:hypothetical protein GCM10009819_25940 [Agromyces tropicus]|uniref:Multidrug transporter n=1 Tax=Agromyces tropicus TaxID=555371 RepID=A0ABN2USU3_9MICO